MTERQETGAPQAPSDAQTKIVITRRDFLERSGRRRAGHRGGWFHDCAYGYLSPNVLFEPPTTFRAGNPDLYPLELGHFSRRSIGVYRAYGKWLLCRISGLHASWLHHPMEARSPIDRLSVSRQQVPDRRNKDRRPGAATAAPLRDFPDRRMESCRWISWRSSPGTSS